MARGAAENTETLGGTDLVRVAQRQEGIVLRRHSRGLRLHNYLLCLRQVVAGRRRRGDGIGGHPIVSARELERGQTLPVLAANLLNTEY